MAEDRAAKPDLRRALHSQARAFCCARHRDLLRRSQRWKQSREARPDKYGVAKPNPYDERVRIWSWLTRCVELLEPEAYPSVDIVLAAIAGEVRGNRDVDRSGVPEEAIAGECEILNQYLRLLDPEQLLRVDPMPYRRSLRQPEQAEWWGRLWGRWGPFRQWYSPTPAGMLAFHTDYFGEHLQGVVKRLLAEAGTTA